VGNGPIGAIVSKDQEGWLVDEYSDASGKSHIREFLSSLQGRDKVEAWALIKLLEERGNQMRSPKSEALGDGLFELRGHQVRIFYVFRPGRRIILLDGILKKQDKIPPKVLARMRTYQKEVSTMDAKDAKTKQGP
jgi:hypothetical protein